MHRGEGSSRITVWELTPFARMNEVFDASYLLHQTQIWCELESNLVTTGSIALSFRPSYKCGLMLIL